MKVIFLDVDGVLNTTDFLRHEQAAAGFGTDEWWAAQIDPRHVAQLQRIVDATGAHVVISSSWRHAANYERMEGILRSRGFRGRVIGQTEDYVAHPTNQLMNGCRGDEIRSWLKESTIGDRYVVLDDSSDMRGVEHRLVLTTTAEGLTPELADKAIAMLNEAIPKEATS